MTLSEQRYRPIPRQVVYEIVEGEVILIQLDRGCYFSLAGSGEALWTMLVEGASPSAAAAALGEHAEDPGPVAGEVAEVVDRLIIENLIEPSESEPQPPAELPPAHRYSTPVLDRYDDMQDFLALDPIHEVAEAGWPHEKPS